MTDLLDFDNLVAKFYHRLESLPDHRTGKNISYSLKDGALGAFSVFFTQSPSFLTGTLGILIVLVRDKTLSLQEANEMLTDMIQRGYRSPVDRLDGLI